MKKKYRDKIESLECRLQRSEEDLKVEIAEVREKSESFIEGFGVCGACGQVYGSRHLVCVGTRRMMFTRDEKVLFGPCCSSDPEKIELHTFRPPPEFIKDSAVREAIAKAGKIREAKLEEAQG